LQLAPLHDDIADAANAHAAAAAVGRTVHIELMKPMLKAPGAGLELSA
jgi:hypothetical protein